MCYERQCSKEGLAGEIVDGDANNRKFSEAELKSLFSPKFSGLSNFHERSKCACCNPGAPTPPKQDRNGFVHLLWNSEELRLADTCLHRAAQATGRVTLAFTKTTDKSGRGFGPPPA